MWTAWAESVSCPRFNKFILLYLRGRPYPAACHLLPKITQAVLGEAFQMPNACWDERHLTSNWQNASAEALSQGLSEAEMCGRGLLACWACPVSNFEHSTALEHRKKGIWKLIWHKSEKGPQDSVIPAGCHTCGWQPDVSLTQIFHFNLNTVNTQQPPATELIKYFNPQPWHYLRSQRHLYNHKSWKHVRLPGHGSMELKQPEVTKVTEVTQSPAWWLPMMYHCSGTNQNPSMVRGQVRILLHIYVKVCPWDDGLFWEVFTYDPGAKDSALRLNQTAHMCVYYWRLQSRWSSYCHSIHSFNFNFYIIWNWVGKLVAIGAGTLSQLVESIIFLGTSRAHLLWSRWSKGRLIDPVVESQTNLSLHSVAFRKVFSDEKYVLYIIYIAYIVYIYYIYIYLLCDIYHVYI